MLSLPCPIDDAETVFLEAAARTKNAVLRRQLLGASAHVKNRSAEYVRLAKLEKLFELAVATIVGVDGSDLAKVYDRVLVKGKGRPLYDRIKAAAKFRRCPLCGERDVRTLDHYLPKESFPELAVFPANLIPSCSDCNKIKLTHVAGCHAEQTFHPYFDDWGANRILSASVTVTTSVEVVFGIAQLAALSDAAFARASYHFETLELGVLYTAKAAVELVESKDTFRRNFHAGGATVLRSELRLTAESRGRVNPNSWRAALYWGLTSSSDFCEGGFNLIDETILP